MKRRLLFLILTLFTLACVPGGGSAPGGDGGQPIAMDALSGDVITSQPLDSLDKSASVGAEAVAVPAAQAVIEPPPLSGEVVPEAAPPANPEPQAEPKPPSSPEEAACLKKKGLWVRAGKSIAYACVKITKDSGKQCRKSSDCQGSCLARSMTCAPYDPLFGCNEILQDDGVRVTLCID